MLGRVYMGRQTCVHINKFQNNKNYSKSKCKCYWSRGKRVTHTMNEPSGEVSAGSLLLDSFLVDREIERHDTKKK